MKRVSLLMMLFAVMIWSANDLYAAKPRTETTTYWVSIHCLSCQQRIMDNLPFEKGVKDISIDIASKKVEVTYDTKRTNSQKISQAFEKLGYEVRILDSGEELKPPTASGTCSGGHAKTDGSPACSGAKAADHKCSGQKSADHKCSGQKSADHKCSGQKSADHKCSGQKSADHKCSGQKSADHKCSGQKSADHKCCGSKDPNHKCCKETGANHKCTGTPTPAHNCSNSPK